MDSIPTASSLLKNKNAAQGLCETERKDEAVLAIGEEDDANNDDDADKSNDSVEYAGPDERGDFTLV